MKRIVTCFLACICLAFTGCYKAFSEIDPNEAGKYVRVLEYTAGSSSIYDASPLSYQFIKGENAYADYSFKAIKLEGPYCVGLYGDPTDFLRTYFKDADLIMGYSSYWFIGTKKKDE